MKWLAMPIVLVAAVTEIRHITRPAAVITSVEEDTLQEIPDDAIASLRMPASLFGQQRIGKQHMGFLALHAMGELHRQGYYCTASGSPDLQVQPPRWYGVRYGSTELYSSTPLEIWRHANCATYYADRWFLYCCLYLRVAAGNRHLKNTKPIVIYVDTNLRKERAGRIWDSLAPTHFGRLVNCNG